MSFYIIIAITAYALYAINGVIDKFFLTKVVRSPAVYAFYIGITAPFTLILAPFGLKMLPAIDILIALISGAAFVLALYFLYKATQATSVSRILPIEGGLVPVFTFVFAYFILDERLVNTQIIAFALLVVGAVIVSLKHDKTGWHAKALGNALVAAMLFALHFVLFKYITQESNLWSGLIWTRFGFFLTSLCFLIPRSVRKAVRNAPKQVSTGNKTLYFAGRATGMIGGFLQNTAISMGSVTIVNAMQGTQYALLLVGTIYLSKYYPKILKEKVTRPILALKILAIVLICCGLVFLSM